MQNIGKFYAINKELFARPNLFKVRITNGTNPKENVFINCFQATVPGLSIATTDKDKAYRSVAYQKIYEDITLGFYCSADMSELKYLQNWMNRIIRPQDNHVEYYEKYALGTIEIINQSSRPSTLVDDENENILTTTLKEAYPKSISSFSLDYGTTGSILNVTATFTYRDYKQEYGDGSIDLAGNVNDNTELSAEDIPQDLTSTIQKTGVKSFDSIGTGSSGSFDFNNQ